ncbi:MAG: ankyrin repeat domain-containing protein [Planctomycetales bacterium]|nr:ankyrin repeat domain-containing protein [Planctomycetales bacterium]
MSEEEVTPLRAVSAAVRKDELETLQALLQQHPELRDYHSVTTPSWLCTAASTGSMRVAQWLIATGMAVNTTDEKGHSCALTFAISNDDMEMVHLLIDNGADPNLCRALFRAIRRDNETLGLAIAEMLVAHGADATKKYNFAGIDEVDAIEFAQLREKPRIHAFLKAASGRE